MREHDCIRFIIFIISIIIHRTSHDYRVDDKVKSYVPQDYC